MGDMGLEHHHNPDECSLRSAMMELHRQQLRMRDEEISHLRDLLTALLKQRDNCNNSNGQIPGIIPDGFSSLGYREIPVELFRRRPLPEKGKLLEAVVEAGPLLQTLFVSGPLPEWRHPPPPLDHRLIPPVPEMPGMLGLSELPSQNVGGGDACKRRKRRKTTAFYS